MDLLAWADRVATRKLYPEQREPLRRTLETLEKNDCAAMWWGMASGKTTCACYITLALQATNPKKILMVMPSSLKTKFMEEIHATMPADFGRQFWDKTSSIKYGVTVIGDSEVVKYVGVMLDTHLPHRKQDLEGRLKSARHSIEAFADVTSAEDMLFDCVGIDESHDLVRNFGSRISRHIHLLGRLCSKNFIMTGTPYVNGRCDVAAQYAFLKSWERIRGHLVQRDSERKSDMIDRVTKQFQPHADCVVVQHYPVITNTQGEKINKNVYMVKVEKDDANAWVASKRRRIMSDIINSKTKGHLELYNEYDLICVSPETLYPLTYLRWKYRVAAVPDMRCVNCEKDTKRKSTGYFHARCRQFHPTCLTCARVDECNACQLEKSLTMCRSNKLEACKKLIEEHPGEKIIIFTRHLKVVEILKQQFPRESYLVMTGDPKNNKDRTIEEFERNAEKKLMIATAQVGSTGFNIVAAQVVIFMDSFWHSCDFLQGYARVNRSKQKNHRTKCYCLLSAGNPTEPESLDEVKFLVSELKSREGECILNGAWHQDERELEILGDKYHRILRHIPSLGILADDFQTGVFELTPEFRRKLPVYIAE